MQVFTWHPGGGSCTYRSHFRTILSAGPGLTRAGFPNVSWTMPRVVPMVLLSTGASSACTRIGSTSSREFCSGGNEMLLSSTCPDQTRCRTRYYVSSLWECLAGNTIYCPYQFAFGSLCYCRHELKDTFEYADLDQLDYAG